MQLDEGVGVVPVTAGCITTVDYGDMSVAAVKEFVDNAEPVDTGAHNQVISLNLVRCHARLPFQYAQRHRVAKLYNCSAPITAAVMLNDRLLHCCDKHNSKLPLADRSER